MNVPTEGKSTSENIWRILYIFFTVTTAILFTQFYKDRYIKYG